MIETQERRPEVETQAELDALIEEARRRARRRRFGYLALATASAGLVLFGVSQFGAGDDSRSGEVTRSTDGGSPKPGVRTNAPTGNELCLIMPALQISGGAGLAAIDQAREGSGLRIDRDNSLTGPLRRAFAYNLQLQLRRAQRVGGDAAEPTVKAAQDALSRVESRPQLLLKEKQLGNLFAEAQTRAEQAGLSNPNCWPPPGA